MSQGFWKKLNKPISAAAPMSNVTDTVFRRLLARHGRPSVMFTEFVSCAGLCSKGKEALLKDLKFNKSERPLVVQFFGSNPDDFYKCAQLAQKLKFDGIDINMGCPDKNVEKQGAGARLMLKPKLAQEIILAAKSGAGDLPVSVKTRVGFYGDELDTWLPAILECNPAAVTIHARDRRHFSAPADWKLIAKAVEIRNTLGNPALILGNGDVKTLSDGLAKTAASKVDGFMVGRALLGNPWFFNSTAKTITPADRLKALVEHTKLFTDIFGDEKNFNDLKKHYKEYLSDFPGAKELRIKFMLAKNAAEVVDIAKMEQNGII